MTRTVCRSAMAAASLLVLSAGSATVGAQTSSSESHVTLRRMSLRFSSVPVRRAIARGRWDRWLF